MTDTYTDIRQHVSCTVWSWIGRPTSRCSRDLGMYAATPVAILHAQRCTKPGHVHAAVNVLRQAACRVAALAEPWQRVRFGFHLQLDSTPAHLSRARSSDPVTQPLASERLEPKVPVRARPKQSRMPPGGQGGGVAVMTGTHPRSPCYRATRASRPRAYSSAHGVVVVRRG